MSDESVGLRLEDFVRTGWMRWVPRTGTGIYSAVLWLESGNIPGDLEEQPPDSRVFQLLDGGLDSSAWPDEDMTGWEPDEVADNVRNENRFKERIVQAARALGITDLATNRDCLEYMRRAGIIEQYERNGQVHWRTVYPLPLPSEVLDLTERERGDEDAFRWGDRFYSLAQRIIGIFVDGEVAALETDLEALAERTESDPESVRHAIQVLLSEGDFTMSVDIERLGPKDRFTLHVDWDKFEASRISVRLNLPD